MATLLIHSLYSDTRVKTPRDPGTPQFKSAQLATPIWENLRIYIHYAVYSPYKYYAKMYSNLPFSAINRGPPESPPQTLFLGSPAHIFVLG